MLVRFRPKTKKALEDICQGYFAYDEKDRLQLVTEERINFGDHDLIGLIDMQTGELAFYGPKSQWYESNNAAIVIPSDKEEKTTTDADDPVLPGLVVKLTNDAEPCIKSKEPTDDRYDDQYFYGIYSGRRKRLVGKNDITVCHEASITI